MPAARRPVLPTPGASAPAAEDPLCALVLQGGGALGSYQGGAFEALHQAGRDPDWVAGISIGAVNAALIAGNPPERRLERLRSFWQRITDEVPPLPWAGADGPLRSWANDWSAGWAALFGLGPFFRPRPGAAWWPGPVDDPSLYDTRPLRDTLCELVDFDRLNDGPMRFSVGAVDVQSGNFAYFDNRSQRICAEHVMASGALPPGFPAVRIGGRAYWDGGLVSNTPLHHVVQHLDGRDAEIFQVDLFSARGPVPRTLAEVSDREKDIRYSSRTRAITDQLRERHAMHCALRELVAMLPPAQRRQPRVAELLQQLGADRPEPTVTLVHIILRHQDSESHTRDYEFSRASMHERWQRGLHDMGLSLRRLTEAGGRGAPESFRVFDYTSRG